MTNTDLIIRICGKGSYYWILDGYYLMNKMGMKDFRKFWSLIKKYAEEPDQVRSWIIGYAEIYQQPDLRGMIRRKVEIVS